MSIMSAALSRFRLLCDARRLFSAAKLAWWDRKKAEFVFLESSR